MRRVIERLGNLHGLLGILASILGLGGFLMQLYVIGGSGTLIVLVVEFGFPLLIWLWLNRIRVLPALSFPRIWELFAFVLPKKFRERVYEPAHQELLEDYLLVRQKYRTKGARRWLAFCFCWRTFWLVVQCFQAVFADKALRGLATLIPEQIKRWWLS